VVTRAGAGAGADSSTKLNTTQLMQTRSMLQGVLERSAPGLLDHMPAIERMVTQLLTR